MMKFKLQGAVLLLSFVFLAGCHHSESVIEDPPLVVSAAQLNPSMARAYEEFTGRTAAVQIVDIKARATGYLEKVRFRDGDDVQAGQVLYEIDPRTYAAEVKANEGAVANAEANLKLAISNLDRAKRLLPKRAISEQDHDTYSAQVEQLTAQLVSAKAALERSELNLGFCKVYAPASGRISRSSIQSGNLVSADQTTLTTIVSMDPIYAYFDVDEQTLLRVQQMIRDELSDTGMTQAKNFITGLNLDEPTMQQVSQILSSSLAHSRRALLRRLLEPKTGVSAVDELIAILDAHPKFESYRDTTVPVELGTRIDKGYPHIGKFDFMDNRLDSTTGTLRVRGVFPNAEGILTPDLSVRIRVPIGEPQPALLVSDAAIITDLDRKFLYVLNEKNEVEQRPVTLGGQFQGMRIILSGVQAGDWIVVSNLQRIRAGMTVSRKEVALPAPRPSDDALPSSILAVSQ